MKQKFKPTRWLIGFAILSITILYSCNDIEQIEPTFDQNTISSVVTSESAEELMEFAPQTPNPYTIPNMQLALDSLIANNGLNCDASKFNIRVTHKYIKFKPQDSIQFGQLIQDTTLILFDYPMDRKLTKAGTYYKDPSLSDDQPNFQWTCVPADKVIPSSIPYDLLADLYLPEEDPQLVQYYQTPFDDCVTKLIETSMKLTGNWDTTENKTTVTSGGMQYKMLPTKWTPAGRITMTDDILGQVPVKGCKVRANRWFETREQLTDNNGYFNVGHQFRFDVNYSIKWERNDFEIRHKRTGQAYFNGPKQRGNWNLNITSGYSRMYAIIHRAAHRYYYEGSTARADLRTPPLKNTMFGRITIGAFNWEAVNANGDCAMIKRWTGFPEIRIFKPSRRSDRIFTTVCHELGHSSHWNLGKNDYTFGDDIVVESWAIGVGNALFQLEYPNTLGRSSNLPDYTLVVIDMVDNPSIEGGSPSNLGFSIAQGDSVTSYTYRNIENSLIGQRKWADWRDKIKNDHNNATENHLDALFDLWD